MAQKYTKRVALKGSERHAVPNAKSTGAIPDNERFEVTIYVRSQRSAQTLAASGVFTDTAPQYRQYLSRDEYAEQHGAAAEDLNEIQAFAEAHNLAVVDTCRAKRSVTLSGRAADFCTAFGVKLEQYEHPEYTYRGRTGTVSIPQELEGIIEGVFGLENRPAARSHAQRRKGAAQPREAGGSFTPVQLASLYNFPATQNGTGQCIGIIELGGGFRPADVAAYFKALNLPAPKIKTIRIDHATNHPSTADGADGEVMLDIEVAAAVATGAQIAVYFAPNTTQGFLDAISAAVHDKGNKPSVISISWGSSESNWTPQALQQYNQAFQAAAALGVTICCSAGDNGATDGEADGQLHVDFPASSPYVLACGGTRVTATPDGSAIASETVWNDNPTTSATGGGISSYFPLPEYQKATTTIAKTAKGFAGRGVPDIAGNADPETGYQVRVDGQEFVIGGTSAVSPLWAGLIARINQGLGHPVGFLNPLLYGAQATQGALRDIVTGGNGGYTANPGWDACTGWGSPNGTKLLQVLSSGGGAAGTGKTAPVRPGLH